MISQRNLRLSLGAFLIFCVVSSKHLVIYNEETLVALSFFLFVIFVAQYFGETISESLQERSQVIQHELHNFLTLKAESSQELVAEYHKVARLVAFVQMLADFTAHELNRFQSWSHQRVQNTCGFEILEKFKLLGFSKLALQQTLQQGLSQNLLSSVVVYCQQHSAKVKLSSKTIDQALNLLATGQSR
jgi:hypothetical protein